MDGLFACELRPLSPSWAGRWVAERRRALERVLIPGHQRRAVEARPLVVVRVVGERLVRRLRIEQLVVGLELGAGPEELLVVRVDEGDRQAPGRRPAGPVLLQPLRPLGRDVPVVEIRRACIVLPLRSV